MIQSTPVKLRHSMQFLWSYPEVNLRYYCTTVLVVGFLGIILIMIVLGDFGNGKGLRSNILLHADEMPSMHYTTWHERVGMMKKVVMQSCFSRWQWLVRSIRVMVRWNQFLSRSPTEWSPLVFSSTSSYNWKWSNCKVNVMRNSLLVLVCWSLQDVPWRLY